MLSDKKMMVSSDKRDFALWLSKLSKGGLKKQIVSSSKLVEMDGQKRGGKQQKYVTRIQKRERFPHSFV